MNELLTLWVLTYEDPAPVDPPPVDSSSDDKTFTQTEVNRILGDDRKKHQAQTQKALDELKSVKAKADLTQVERNELDSRIDTLQNELMTKEELAKQEKDKLQTNYKKDVEKLISERDTWQKRYSVETIDRSIADAAIEHKAVSAEQMRDMLRSKTRLVEELGEDGKPTGKHIPKVKFEDVDKAGNPVVLELSPDETLKRMKEIEKHFNLFQGDGKGGYGGMNRPSGGKEPDAAHLAKDPKTYREARKSGQLTF